MSITQKSVLYKNSHYKRKMKLNDIKDIRVGYICGTEKGYREKAHEYFQSIERQIKEKINVGG